MPQFSVTGFDDEHFRRTEQYVKKVRNIYNAAIREAARIGVALNYNTGTKPFRFQDFAVVREQINRLFADAAAKIEAVINEGTAGEWDHANDKNDAFVNSVLKTDKLPERALARLMGRNAEARAQFQKRRSNGLGLSDRVWNNTKQFRSELEMAIEVGITDGRSADELSRDIRSYLEDPDKLFRRVRDKPNGPLRLSQHAQQYKPGRGVYRSSYKNAMRLTRTEINMAYRESDYTRWQKLDFVVGIEVRRSNNPYPCSVCESLKGRYPKTFKFRSWHPQCRCHAISILASDKEINEIERRMLNGEDTTGFVSENTIDVMPQGFVSWINANKTRILAAQSQPYFIQDNFKGGRLSGGLKLDITAGVLSKSGIKRNAKFTLDESAVDFLKEQRGFNISGNPENYNALMEGFDISDLDADLTEIAQEKGFEWQYKELSISKGRVMINYSGQYRKDNIGLMRTFHLVDGALTVEHDLFFMPDSLQGGGTSKSVFRRLYKQYKNAGVKRINVHANIDVGGYAWARYGFSMTRKADVKWLYETANKKLSKKQLERFMKIYDQYKDQLPFPVRHIAREPYAKDLLLNSDWYGTIDLADAEQAEYFENYLLP